MKREPSGLSSAESGFVTLLTWWEEVDGRKVTCYGIGTFVKPDTVDNVPVLVFEDLDYVAVPQNAAVENCYRTRREWAAIRLSRVHAPVHLNNPKEPTTIHRELHLRTAADMVGRSVAVTLREILEGN